VPLDDAGAHTEGSEMGGGTGDGEGFGGVVDDVHGAGVVEVDEDGGDGGVVVDGDLLVRAVVDADDLEGVVGQDGGVVGGEGARVLLGGDGDWTGEEQKEGEKLVQARPPRGVMACVVLSGNEQRQLHR